MIVVTGAAGFIGSVMVGKLNNKGYTDIVPVDDFSRPEKDGNLSNKAIHEKVDRNMFFAWLDKNHREVDFIFHLGARTDTTEFDTSVFDKLNLNYSKDMWNACVKYGIPLVYASSAATYGMGELGYDDRHDIITKLKPLNLFLLYMPWVKSKKPILYSPGFRAGYMRTIHIGAGTLTLTW